jgi:hypothetical protein
MNQFVEECQFTFEDLRDCALLLDEKNPKLCDICKKHIYWWDLWSSSSCIALLHIDLFQFIYLGLHKKSYVETSVNPESYSGAISFQSSIHQDIILDVQLTKMIERDELQESNEMGWEIFQRDLARRMNAYNHEKLWLLKNHTCIINMSTDVNSTYYLIPS